MYGRARQEKTWSSHVNLQLQYMSTLRTRITSIKPCKIHGRVVYATPSKGKARLVLARAPKAGVQVLRADVRQQRGRRLLARLAERQLRPAAGAHRSAPRQSSPNLACMSGQQASFALLQALPRSRSGLLSCPHVVNGA